MSDYESLLLGIPTLEPSTPEGDGEFARLLLPNGDTLLLPDGSTLYVPV